MVAHVTTVALAGIQAVPVEVQVSVASGMPSFAIVGLADKAVAESRERVRAALGAIALALPPKRITVNLAPADLVKEGSHYDLPIAVGLMVALGALPADAAEEHLVLGELGLDGRISPVAGVLPTAIAAGRAEKNLICPAANGSEAAWAGQVEVVAPDHLLALVNHLKGTQVLAPPEPKLAEDAANAPDLQDIKGQEAAKRALEIAAAGGHNLLDDRSARRRQVDAGPAARRHPAAFGTGRGAGNQPDRLGRRRTGGREGQPAPALPRSPPFRQHGGARRRRPQSQARAKRRSPTTASLFLDELPEFQRQVLDALRQPVESGECVVARANHHVTYPARFQLVAAMNPVPLRLSLRSRTRLHARAALRRRTIRRASPAPCSTASICMWRCRRSQPPISPCRHPPKARPKSPIASPPRGPSRRTVTPTRPMSALTRAPTVRSWKQPAKPDAAGQQLLSEATDRLRLSARGYHRVLRVARTIADLAGAEQVGRVHLAEALGYRRIVLER